mmetsp:Transcript_14553/g.50220  ORF Transcript_14553/g.50220 Transcript_14553/m.50220 type:complete len:203 (+) Transcript_14553:113-721(+)
MERSRTNLLNRDFRWDMSQRTSYSLPCPIGLLGLLESPARSPGSKMSRPVGRRADSARRKTASGTRDFDAIETHNRAPESLWRRVDLGRCVAALWSPRSASGSRSIPAPAASSRRPGTASTTRRFSSSTARTRTSTGRSSPRWPRRRAACRNRRSTSAAATGSSSRPGARRASRGASGSRGRPRPRRCGPRRSATSSTKSRT